MPDDMNVILAKEGNRDAFRRLYEEHRERIFRTAYRYTHSQQDAEDIMQETFIKAFKRIHTFDFHVSPNFSSWLLSICINASIDQLRRRDRRMEKKHVSLSDLTRETASANPSPEETAIRRRATDAIRESLRVPSPRQRVIFDMRYKQHLDVKNIAESLRCSESNVKTQLFRSLAKLRSTLEPNWGKP